MRFAKALVIAGIVGCAFALASGAHAQTNQFASFTQGSNATGSPFAFDTYTGQFYLTDGTTSTASYSYTDAGGTLHTGTYTKFNQISTINVNFVYQTANAYGATPGSTTIAATLSFTAQANLTGPNGSGSSATAGPFTFEGFNSIQMSFQANTAHLGLDGLMSTNLLTVNTDKTAAQTNGTFQTNTLQSTNGSLTAAQNSTSPGGLVGYSSDFLDFINPTFNDKDFTISFAGITPAPVTTNGGTGTGNMTSFLANAAGTFNSDPIPPAPATPGETSAMIGIAVAGAQFGMVRFRRRKAAKKSAQAA